MTAEKARWRQWIDSERPLLRELAVLLLACLALGLYFLEHFDSRLERERQRHLEALASLMAESAAEYTATGNLVSLNVLARQAGALAPVARVALTDAGGRLLASSGEAGAGTPVEQTMRLADGGIVGRVSLYPAASSGARQQLEAGFVLLVLCLLGLRVVWAMGARRLRGEPLWRVPEPETMPVAPPGATPPQETSPVAAQLCLTLVNAPYLRGRYTDTLFAALLAPYERLLQEVVAQYRDARLLTPLGEGAVVVFEGVEAEQAALRAICAGWLFLHGSRSVAEQRKRARELPLEFKLLVTVEQDAERNRAVCEAGVPGRLSVPQAELLALSLDRCVLYQPDQAVGVQYYADAQYAEDAQHPALQLQPLLRLAQRYQQQITEQAEQLGQPPPPPAS